MLKTIVCSFEDKTNTDLAISSLYNKFRGEIRIVSGEPGGLIQSMSNCSTPINEMVSVFCSGDICDDVVKQIGILGADRIYYS